MNRHVWYCQQKAVWQTSNKPNPAKPSNIQETFLLQIPWSHFHQLSQAEVVTIVDLSKNSYHIELDEATLFSATFNTVFRRFGLSVAEDKFQYKLGTIFTTLAFCTGIVGGLIIWNEEANWSDHENIWKGSLKLWDSTIWN